MLSRRGIHLRSNWLPKFFANAPYSKTALPCARLKTGDTQWRGHEVSSIVTGVDQQRMQGGSMVCDVPERGKDEQRYPSNHDHDDGAKQRSLMSGFGQTDPSL